MQRRLFFLILSLSVHLLIILLIRAFSAGSPTMRSIRIDLIQNAVTTPVKPRAEEEIVPRPETLDESETHPDVSIQPDSRPEGPSDIPDYAALFDSLYDSARLSADSSSLYNQDAWKQFVLKKVKEQYFSSIHPVPFPEDSNVLAFSLEGWEYPLSQGDEVADKIYQRNTGVTPLPSLLGLLSKIIPKKSDKEPDPQFDFIPTETQIRAMDVLYTKKKATQLEIYPMLDTSQPITAEGLNRQLEVLINKGFLSRKKISPEYHFVLFGTPVEISSKNRKNQLYLYESNVNKKKLLDFLQAQLYLNQDELRAHPADSLTIMSRIHSFQQKIQILME